MLRHLLNDAVNWQTTKVEQLSKVSSLCLDVHQFKQEEFESVGELSEVCSQIVLECLYLARIGRFDITLSVNKLARSVTKWIQACDRRLTGLISSIHRANDFRQHCFCGKHGFLEDSDFAGALLETLTTQNQHQEVLCAFLEEEHFVPVSWVCNKQTSVSHSSQNLESFHWMLDYAWMGYLLSMFGTL